MTAPLVVVGGGLAAWTTVREFRKRDTSTPVTVVTADAGDFYAKPSLSNAFAQRKAPHQLVTTPAAQMAQAMNVQLRPHAQAQSLDTAACTLAVAGETLSYSQLVLATGARPVRAALQGDGAQDVLSVNSLDDFAALHARLVPGAHVLIMGAGLIGCEFANDLAGAGYLVSVVDPGRRPLAGLLPEGASAALQTSLERLGVRWHFGRSLRRVERKDGGLWVELSDGDWMPADVVLSAIGLKPETTLAEGAGLRCARGIVVDEHLRTSDSRIFAIGDCAQYDSAGARPLPFVMPIMHAARALADTLAGSPTRVQFPVMPVAVKTPAQPLVVAPPSHGQDGAWLAQDEGVWHYRAGGETRGFALAGPQTARRMEMTRLLGAACAGPG